ncbi:MAG: hypothetical protein PHI63_04585 [Patescibacteria group bacterium]|nr:hypothetical protein [Patescibacteria group bacterium]
MEIFSQASALAPTLPEAIREAGQLGVGLQVHLQPCKDALMVTLGGVHAVPHTTPDWKEFTFDELRHGWGVDQYGHLNRAEPDERTLSRPMPLQELLVRWRHYQSRCFFTRLLLNAGGEDFAPLVAEAVERSGISGDHVVCSTYSVRSAVNATERGFQTVLTLTEKRWWEDGAPGRWRELVEHFGRRAVPAIRCEYRQLLPTAPAALSPWRLFLDCERDLGREQFGSFKTVERVEAVICPDPVVALMA